MSDAVSESVGGAVRDPAGNPAAAARRRARTELGAALLLFLAGGALLLLASGRPWGTARLPPPVRSVGVTGGELSGLPYAAGLLGIAGMLALVATRRYGRLVVGGLLAAVAVATLVVDVSAVGRVTARVRATDAAVRAVGTGARQLAVHGTVWPWVSVVGAVLLLLGSLLVLARGARWAGMSARYDAPGTPRRVVDPEVELWDSFDRGDDPTAPG